VKNLEIFEKKLEGVNYMKKMKESKKKVKVPFFSKNKTFYFIIIISIFVLSCATKKEIVKEEMIKPEEKEIEEIKQVEEVKTETKEQELIPVIGEIKELSIPQIKDTKTEIPIFGENGKVKFIRDGNIERLVFKKIKILSSLK
jgi:hypothetical protein